MDSEDAETLRYRRQEAVNMARQTDGVTHENLIEVSRAIFNFVMEADTLSSEA